MKEFRTDNTEGYTETQLAELNAEWEMIVKTEGLQEYTEEYDIAASDFADEVARR